MIDDYVERFKSVPIEQKRKDLSVHPAIIADQLPRLTDEDIERLYLLIYASFDIAMQEVIGESMFDDYNDY